MSFRSARHLQSTLLCLALLMVASGAHATVEYALQTQLTWHQVDNPLNLSNKSSQYNLTNYDNNGGLFRPQDYQKYHSSSSYWTHGLGAGVFIPFPSERSFLQLTGKMEKDHDSPIDDAKSYQWSGLYHLEVSSFLEGTFQHKESKTNYDLFNGFPKRLFTYYDPATDTKHIPNGSYLVQEQRVQNEISLGLKVTPHWKIPFSVSRSQSSYLHDNDVSPFNDNSTVYQTGIRYQSGKGSIFTLGVKRNETKFPNKSGITFFTNNPIDLLNGNALTNNTSVDCIANPSNSLCNETKAANYTSYVDHEIYSETQWMLSPDSLIKGKVNYIQRKFDQGQDNRLFGILLNAQWQYSTKTKFDFHVWENNASINNDDRYRALQSEGVLLNVFWQATYKSGFRAMASVYREHYDYFSNANIGTVGEKTKRLGIEYKYDVTPKAQFTVGAERQMTSGSDGANYKRLNVSASITYTFENMQGNNRAKMALDQLSW